MSDYPAQPLADGLSGAKSPAHYDAALHGALDFFDELQTQIVQASGAKIVCRAGCSLCCGLRVDVFAHEVFLLAHHIRTRFSAGELAALLARLAPHAERVRALTPFEHATQNITCPLLKADGCCGVYEARPHACRRHHSLDFTACQFTYDHPTDLEFPGAHDLDLFRALTAAMQESFDVYADFGYDATIYELSTALTEALTAPASWRRWRDKKRAFVKASVTPAA